MLTGSPRRGLVVATGNITNAAPMILFEKHRDAIVRALDEADFVELTPTTLIVYHRHEHG